MIVKQFVEGFIANNNYLLIDEESKEAALIDCTDYISELGAVLKEYDGSLLSIYIPLKREEFVSTAIKYEASEYIFKK